MEARTCLDGFSSGLIRKIAVGVTSSARSAKSTVFPEVILTMPASRNMRRFEASVAKMELFMSPEANFDVAYARRAGLVIGRLLKARSSCVALGSPGIPGVGVD